VGVVLSGNRDDGTAGLAAIKARGGATIVQDPDDALYSGMPANALANVDVDAVVPSDRIAEAIEAVVKTNGPPSNPGSGSSEEPGTGSSGAPGSGSGDNPAPKEGEPVSVCPECGGILTEEHQAGIPQWACRVGHRYSAESLVDAQATSVEAALWSAIRALEERGDLLERLSVRCEAQQQRRSAIAFRSKANDARHQAEIVRTALAAASRNALRLVSAADDEAGEASGS
jgi:two-component system chemotaxis response regulator CheB